MNHPSSDRPGIRLCRIGKANKQGTPEGMPRTYRKSQKRRWKPVGIASFYLFGAIALANAMSVAHAQTPVRSCHGALHRRQIAQMLFGRDIGRHLGVSEAAWKRFVAREITPRFPGGLTVIDSSGQWRGGPAAAIVREPSKIVEILLPGNPDDEARLGAIASAYKRQFRQRSVGIIVQSACVLF